jgi:hypothetical protein
MHGRHDAGRRRWRQRDAAIGRHGAPGEKINLHRFEVPDAWDVLLSRAEAALARLHRVNPYEWETFVIGEQSEAEAVERRFDDLPIARRVLHDYFQRMARRGSAAALKLPQRRKCQGALVQPTRHVDQ